jgi:histidyl-tRNA synthetase
VKISALNGFKDILPDEVVLWQRVEKLARDIFTRFHFSEIRMPILEKTDLFARSIGEATDIVEKEMYTFVDKQITMRPEGTASMLRAYIQHGLHVQKPVQRLFTIGPMFRHERPQKGRLRQFHQISVEVLGTDLPRVDAELMAMAALIIQELGLSVSLEINSLGCPKCRPDFNKALFAYISGIDDLCDDCQRRRTTNPLRVLDCKNEQCQSYYKDAPSILDHLCGDCKTHFTAVKADLDRLKIDYQVNHFMVRGLDYYTRTTFELITGDLGSQSAVGAGGRYDGLVKQLGGPDVPGIGFGMGMERLTLLLNQKDEKITSPGIDIFIAALGEKAQNLAFELCHELRSSGLFTAMDYQDRALKNQMKQADRAKADFTLIIGEDELQNNSGILRNMQTRDQYDVPLGINAAEGAVHLIKQIETA